jgi:cell wall-associated NlpC family hydrolase
MGRAAVSPGVEREERKRFIDAAMTYLGTPYHHCGEVKGAGVDCATLLVCAARDAGLIPKDWKVGAYSPQWHLNRTAQNYLAKIGELCVEVPFPAIPGDIMIFQFGRTFSHGGIVLDDTRIIHADILNRCVAIDDISRNRMFGFMGEADGRPRLRMLMSLWPR